MGLSVMNPSLSFSSVYLSAILTLIYLGSTTTSALSVNETDFYSLLDFKAKITHDPFEVLNSWNDTIHFCQLRGVTCSRRHRKVTVLSLNSMNLAGSISPSIANLSFLRELHLENNTFSNAIPQEIFHLPRLKKLLLTNNSLSGKIPTNISTCSNLVRIDLGYNLLKGGIPEEIGNLFKLQFLDIYDNKLSGTIPRSIGNLSNLEEFSVYENNMVGTIPETVGQLKNLTFLSLGTNRLSGTIPPSFFNLSSISTLDISDNNLQGNLPSDLGISFPSIQYFVVAMNDFTGNIPSSFSNASNLVQLEMPINHLTGKVPSLEKLSSLASLSLSINHLGSGGGEVDDLSFLYSLTNITSLQLLAINENNFGGILPEIICNFSSELTILSMSNNHILGSIPSEIWNLVGLQYFDVSINKLSGIIPHNIGKLRNLGLLNFNMNTFFGQLPSSLGNLTDLAELHAGGNNLVGKIPSSLGTCKNLLRLNLSRNNLSDAIPPQVLSLSSLAIFLDLSKNQLTGTLPIEVGNLKSLGKFDVSTNKLSGEIPSSLGSCTSMEVLHMEGNNFQGSIPLSLNNLKALQFLDLSHNNFSGEVPEFLSHFVLLQYLNLSHNNFEGMVPTEGVFINVTATSLEGNNKLCGGIPEFHLPVCISKRPKKTGLSVTLKIVIAVISALLGVTLVLLIPYVFWFKQKKRKEPSSNVLYKKILELSYQTLYNVSDGFSSANLIGMGSFGSVYKGALDQGDTLIAIKVFNLVHRGAFKSFLAECEALRNIRHRNLVKVLTVCSSVDNQGNDFKALVYEFMANGSLEEWLHPPTTVASRNLNILQRLNIAIDVACALDYLHNHCEIPIIHCDLKPSNILLDEEMTGHVADFGLAKFYIESSHCDAVNQSSSIGIRGTLGYAPPEYGMANEVSTCGDVYSYGILLLEMFTGKRPTDDTFNQGFNLHKYVKAAASPEQVVEILDPTLVQGAHSNRTIQCLKSIFGIGAACSMESPGERMSSTDAVGKLVSIRDKLVRN